jgi:hypothetical protein
MGAGRPDPRSPHRTRPTAVIRAQHPLAERQPWPDQAKQDEQHAIHDALQVACQAHAGVRQEGDGEATQEAEQEQEDAELDQAMTHAVVDGGCGHGWSRAPWASRNSRHSMDSSVRARSVWMTKSPHSPSGAGWNTATSSTGRIMTIMARVPGR